MRIYIDLWVKKLDDKTLYLFKKLGYKAIAHEGESIATKDIVVVKKKVVRVSSKSELLEALKGIKRDKVIVSVKPLSIEVARAAAHDSRVDTIIIDRESLKYIDKPQINLMKQFVKPLELPLSSFLKYSPSIRAMIYRRIKYYFFYAKQPIIVSSCAETWNEIMIPKSTIYLLSQLFDLSPKETILFITTYPREILIHNGVSI